jgi:hypothetical protein
LSCSILFPFLHVAMETDVQWGHWDTEVTRLTQLGLETCPALLAGVFPGPKFGKWFRCGRLNSTVAMETFPADTWGWVRPEVTSRVSGPGLHLCAAGVDWISRTLAKNGSKFRTVLEMWPWGRWKLTVGKQTALNSVCLLQSVRLLRWELCRCS